jgi:acetyltransferase-like isoleucine patch superfamily enzyme
MRRITFLVLMLLPSWLKVLVLRRLGHEIGADVRIGICYLDVRKIVLQDHVRIASFNYFKNLRQLTMLESARIGGCLNWFTAAAANDEGNPGFGRFELGRGSNITGRHFFDLADEVRIGNETLVAGFSSVCLTHTYTSERRNINRPIRIGDRCYVGSHVIFLPGSAVGDRNFVGAGSVVTKDLSAESGVLVAGNPARVRRRYPMSSWFFATDHSSFASRLAAHT